MMPLQRVGLCLRLHCTQFGLHKQMGPDKRHLIEAAVIAAAGSTRPAVAVENTIN